MTNGKAERAMTSGGLVKTSVQFAPDQLDEIDRLAVLHRLTRPAMLRQIVDAGIQRIKQLDKIAEAVA